MLMPSALPWRTPGTEVPGNRPSEFDLGIQDTYHPTILLQAESMDATVAERGQITLPKAVRDALGLTKGTLLKVELDGSRIILRKNADDAVSRLRGRFKLPAGVTTDDIMRELRGRAPGDPVEP